ncbi:GNAT family N-acetyltransferase [Sphaerisporangium sp. TRM90804]|uniref:GNAT family N-acetyltransferase n=1 Tax=Sphaerisporangium sp. TRM90804 TaxID=3031113 RepID=UPI0024470180|nr:GNAT family N-acetyltransferase [Sphaerisporangium sp. TRM90804]MDH2425421.1 hypothetical protein [Sphaerisporangium sp. TRM90804]
MIDPSPSPSPRSRPEPAVLELVEAEAMYRFESGAPAETREALGIECVRLGGGVVLSMRNDPTGYWNKALGFGITEPVTADLVAEVCDFFRSRGVPGAVVQIAPSVLPADWDEIRAKYGLFEGSSWVKLARDLSVPVPEAEGGPEAERVEAPEAARWASVLMRGFGMPEGPLVDMTAAAVAMPGFRAYVTRSGGDVVSSAGLYTHHDAAQLVGAATLPSHRGRGAQTAMLRARIQAAAAAGCRWLCADTGVERPGEHNTSLRNLTRAGFESLYVRQNWTWRP